MQKHWNEVWKSSSFQDINNDWLILVGKTWECLKSRITWVMLMTQWTISVLTNYSVYQKRNPNRKLCSYKQNKQTAISLFLQYGRIKPEKSGEWYGDWWKRWSTYTAFTLVPLWPEGLIKGLICIQSNSLTSFQFDSQQDQSLCSWWFSRKSGPRLKSGWVHTYMNQVLSMPNQQKAINPNQTITDSSRLTRVSPIVSDVWVRISGCFWIGE